MNRKKHILVLPQWYPNKTDVQLGGFIQQQIQLVKEEFDFSVIYVLGIEVQQEKWVTEVSTNNGVNEVILYFRLNKGPFRKIINFFRFKKAQIKGYTLLENPVDLVHLQVPLRVSLLALKLHKKNIPFLVTEHWSGHLNGEFNALKKPDKSLYIKALKQATKITVVSNALAHAFQQNTHFVPEIIPNPIFGSPSPYPDFSNDIRILTVGDLNNVTKNYLHLLEEFKLATLENSHLKLTIVGDGPDKATILAKIAALNLEKSVELLGRLDQEKVQQEYPKAHFFISNSITETFGMAIAESIANGRPVIATKSGGPNAFVTDKNGILIASNSKNLHQTILKMANTFHNYNSNDIANEILGKFGQEAIRKQWLTLYTEVLEK